MSRQSLVKAGVCFLVLLCACFASAQADPDFVALTDARVAAWRPSPDEKRFDEVGWSTDIRAALQLAAEHHRPVFLFTHDGRMGVGRQ